MSCGAGNIAIVELRELRAVVATLTERVKVLETLLKALGDAVGPDPEDGEDISYQLDRLERDGGK